MRRELPSGTVTFLFTDIEGSTKLLEELGEEDYAEVLAEHHRVCREAWLAHQGVEVDTEGDAFFVVFEHAPEALAAAEEAQQALASGPVSVRMGLHTGDVLVRETGYVGRELHRAARIAASAHGGQIVLSQQTREHAGDDGFAFTELGEHRFKDFEEPVSILQLGNGSFPPLKTLSNTNLPRPASSFVGRKRELSEILSRLGRDARLVTLTGPGGTGKTRLALEAAATLVPEYKAGVFWVGLAALRDHVLVTETIAHSLGAKDGLAEHIGEREMLLLLDNFEQVVDAAPDLSGLLAACPNLTLVVTSRELLRVQGEVEYAVPPLEEAEAVSLFSERAQMEPSDEIVELSRRLDYLPLAVELAAARTNALSPRQILQRLTDRLDLLKGTRDADPRQQTLRATIEWSYELLSSAEQQLFRRLSVFVGGCSLATAEEVAGADLDTLQLLVEKSLLRFSNERYWMLETIREYAFSRLRETSESDELRQRHAKHFLDLAEQADTQLRDSVDMGWLARLEAEQANLRAGLQHALEQSDPALALRLVGALAYFWWVHGHLTEGRRSLDIALQLPPQMPTRERGRALNGAAALAVHAGDLATGRQYSEESLEIWRTLDDWDGTVRALNELGKIALVERQFDRSERLFEEAADIARDRDHPLWVLVINVNRAEAALVRGDEHAARSMFLEVVADARKLEHPIGLTFGLGGAAQAALALKQEAEARNLVAELLPLAVELGFKENIYTALMLAAELVKREQPEAVARLLGAAATVREEAGIATDSETYDELLAYVSDVLDGERLRRGLDEGRLMEVDEAARFALDLFSALPESQLP